MELLPHELVYQIALDAKIENLKNWYQTYKKITIICSNNRFWQDKFKYDNIILPLNYPTMFNEWIVIYDEYMRITDMLGRNQNIVLNYNYKEASTLWKRIDNPIDYRIFNQTSIFETTLFTNNKVKTVETFNRRGAAYGMILNTVEENYDQIAVIEFLRIYLKLPGLQYLN